MRKRVQHQSGRLLSEFLVSLGLFFLILTADLSIVDLATDSASQARTTQFGLGLAQNALEDLIADSRAGKAMVRHSTHSQSVSKGKVVRFNQTVRVAPMAQFSSHLSLATVVVDWDNGRRKIRLERYVAGR